MPTRRELLERAADSREFYVWSRSTPKGWGLTAVVYGQPHIMAEFVPEFGGYVGVKQRGDREGQPMWKITDNPARVFLVEVLPLFVGKGRWDQISWCIEQWDQHRI